MHLLKIPYFDVLQFLFRHTQDKFTLFWFTLTWPSSLTYIFYRKKTVFKLTYILLTHPSDWLLCTYSPLHYPCNLSTTNLPRIPYLDFGHITRKIYWVKNPLTQNTLLGCVAIFIYTSLRLTTIDDLLSKWKI